MKIMIPSEKAKILEEQLNYDEATKTLELGGNVEVDGVLTASGGEEVITSAQAVIDQGKPQLNLKQGEEIVEVVDLSPLASAFKTNIYYYNVNLVAVDDTTKRRTIRFYGVLNANITNYQDLQERLFYNYSIFPICLYDTTDNRNIPCAILGNVQLGEDNIVLHYIDLTTGEYVSENYQSAFPIRARILENELE